MLLCHSTVSNLCFLLLSFIRFFVVLSWYVIQWVSFLFGSCTRYVFGLMMVLLCMHFSGDGGNNLRDFIITVGVL